MHAPNRGTWLTRAAPIGTSRLSWSLASTDGRAWSASAMMVALLARSSGVATHRWVRTSNGVAHAVDVKVCWQARMSLGTVDGTMAPIE